MSDPTTAPTATGHRVRRVDWLELFFDLVFVVVIKQLTDRLHGEPAPFDFVLVALLLVFAWTVWLNVTMVTNVATDNAPDRRIAVLASMAGVAVLAISIPNALGDGALLLALGLAIPRVAMWPLWLKQQGVRGRRAIRPTIIGPGVAALIMATLLLPEPVRPWVWLVLVIVPIAVTLPMLATLPYIVSHLVERVSLFVMIVLGESVVELILAVEPDQSLLAWGVTLGGFVLICAFFWMYFQGGAQLAERVLEHRSVRVLTDVILIGHYGIVLGLIGVAAGLGAAIEHADDDHLPFAALVALCGGVIVYYLSNVFIGARYGVPWRTLLILSPLTFVIPLLVLLLGQGWAPWLIVLLLIVDTTLHALIGPKVGRKIPED